MSNNEINKEDLAEKAKSYIREQKELGEVPTKEGWFDSLREDFIGGWEDLVHTFTDTWEAMSKMEDAIFGMDKDQK